MRSKIAQRILDETPPEVHEKVKRYADKILKKSKQGGARKGAGRPKKEPTTTMRVPTSKVEAIKKLIGKAKTLPNSIKIQKG